jgi:hypothetical protein
MGNQPGALSNNAASIDFVAECQDPPHGKGFLGAVDLALDALSQPEADEADQQRVHNKTKVAAFKFLVDSVLISARAEDVRRQLSNRGQTALFSVHLQSNLLALRLEAIRYYETLGVVATSNSAKEDHERCLSGCLGADAVAVQIAALKAHKQTRKPPRLICNSLEGARCYLQQHWGADQRVQRGTAEGWSPGGTSPKHCP